MEQRQSMCRQSIWRHFRWHWTSEKSKNEKNGENAEANFTSPRRNYCTAQRLLTIVSGIPFRNGLFTVITLIIGCSINPRARRVMQRNRKDSVTNICPDVQARL